MQLLGEWCAQVVTIRADGTTIEPWKGMMVSGLSGAVSAVGFGGMALAMLLSDRGNGVVRISRVCLVAVPLMRPDGWAPIAFPFSVRVRDAVTVALGILGRRPCPGVAGGVCRPVTDADVEYLVYRVG